jgi:hypothetical protein
MLHADRGSENLAEHPHGHVTAYDKLDWHYDSALEAGQATENAFTRIGPGVRTHTHLYVLSRPNPRPYSPPITRYGSTSGSYQDI